MWENILKNGGIRRKIMKYKIVYLHGLGGGANSRLPNKLKEQLGDDYEIIAKDIPLNPKEAADFTFDLVFDTKPDLVVASSLGGFYALRLCGTFKTLVINPAMTPHIDIKNAIGYGKYEYRVKRENGDTTYTIDKDFISELEKLYTRYEHAFDYEYVDGVYAIFGGKDELFSHKEDFAKLYDGDNMLIVPNATHHLSNDDIADYVVPTIKSILVGNF